MDTVECVAVTMVTAQYFIVVMQCAEFSDMELLILLSSITTVAFCTCPPAWNQHDESCYKVFNTRTTFMSALRRCAGHQGHLLSIKNPRENRFIQTIVSRYLDNQFWIGIHFNATSWYWLEDGTEVTWSRWTGTKSACALMTGSLKWATEKCSYYHQYICELDLKMTSEESSTAPPSTSIKDVQTSDDVMSSSTSTTTTTFDNIDYSTTRLTTVTSTSGFSTIDATTQSSVEDITPEVVVVDRKKNPGRTHIDNRPSAIGIGSMGIVVLVCVFLGVCLLDASKLWRDLTMFRHNVAEIIRHMRRPRIPKQGRLHVSQQ